MAPSNAICPTTLALQLWQQPLPNPTDLFYQIVARYSRHVVANIFFGHIHEDHQFMIYYANKWNHAKHRQCPLHSVDWTVRDPTDKPEWRVSHVRSRYRRLQHLWSLYILLQRLSLQRFEPDWPNILPRVLNLGVGLWRWVVSVLQGEFCSVYSRVRTNADTDSALRECFALSLVRIEVLRDIPIRHCVHWGGEKGSNDPWRAVHKRADNQYLRRKRKPKHNRLTIRISDTPVYSHRVNVLLPYPLCILEVNPVRPCQDVFDDLPKLRHLESGRLLSRCMEIVCFRV